MSISNEYFVLASAGLLLFVSCLYLCFSSSRRGPARLRSLRWGIVLLALSLPIVVIYLSKTIGFAPSDTMAVLGLLLAFLFGFAGNKFSNLFSKVRVAVVIPSKAAFFKDVRRGLREELSDLPVTIDDEYDSIFRASEDIVDFESILRRACRRRPDFMLLCCPAAGFADRTQVSSILEDITSRGGAVFFIENGPADARLSALRNAFVLESDHNEGVLVLAEYVKAAFADAVVVLINGPMQSEPARVRAARFRELLPNVSVELCQMSGWTALAAESAVDEVLRTNASKVIFLCGNDSMALGAVKSIQKARRTEAFVIGYDGIREALASIGAADSPFVATLRTPPSAYGYEAGGLIKRICSGRAGSVKGRRVKIAIDGSHLITKWNVHLVLDELW